MSRRHPFAFAGRAIHEPIHRLVHGPVTRRRERSVSAIDPARIASVATHPCHSVGPPMDQSSEKSSDRSMERDDGRWLTYPELAGVRGIDKPSAIRLATRKKWRRQRDNHRVVRVLVPTEWLSPRYQSMDRPIDQSRDRAAEQSMEQPSRDMDRSGDRADFAAAVAAIEAAHTGEVAALHGQIAGLKSAVDVATASLAEANAGRAQAAERASRAEALVTSLEADLQAKDSELAVQQLAAEQARNEAQSTHERAETLRAAIDELRAGQGLLAETHDAELAAAQDAARKAEEQAEALRQAEAERKGRGRLRRAWAAWRGE